MQSRKGSNASIKCLLFLFCSLFGDILIASTPKGICYMGFHDQKNDALSDLKSRFPKATFLHQSDVFQENAAKIYQNNWKKMDQIKLHLKGTDFQLKVWEALLKIPSGKLTSYGNLAKSIDQPNASRAVGTAIGSNPIAYFIPCHRVIQSTGLFGGYMWGSTRKSAIIGWELAQINPENEPI